MEQRRAIYLGLKSTLCRIETQKNAAFFNIANQRYKLFQSFRPTLKNHSQARDSSFLVAESMCDFIVRIHTTQTSAISLVLTLWKSKAFWRFTITPCLQEAEQSLAFTMRGGAPPTVAYEASSFIQRSQTILPGCGLHNLEHKAWSLGSYDQYPGPRQDRPR